MQKEGGMRSKQNQGLGTRAPPGQVGSKRMGGGSQGATARSVAGCSASGEPRKWGGVPGPRQRGLGLWALCWGSLRGAPAVGRGCAPADCLLPLVLKAK